MSVKRTAAFELLLAHYSLASSDAAHIRARFHYPKSNFDFSPQILKFSIPSSREEDGLCELTRLKNTSKGKKNDRALGDLDAQALGGNGLTELW